MQSMEPESRKTEPAEQKAAEVAQPPPVPARPSSLLRSPVRVLNAAPTPTPMVVDALESGSSSLKQPSLAIAVSEDPFFGLEVATPSPHFATAKAIASTRRR